MFRRLIATLFGTAKCTPIRNANRARLNAEEMEAREVPASYLWQGLVSSDALNTLNWFSPDAPGTLPDVGANISFANVRAGSTADCTGFGVTSGAYNSVTFVSNYPGTAGRTHLK
jgi:hypothetical protein